jgi:hypothetical protein
MTASQRKGYRGEDNLYVKDSKLMRQFPIYDGIKATGEKRLLEYSLHSNNFSVRTVSSDTSANAKKADVAATPAPLVKKDADSKKSSSKKQTSEKKKSHKTETKKKKKKHHSSN